MKMKNFEKGNNSAMTNPMDKKKIRVSLILILVPHTKFQDPFPNGSLTGCKRNGQTDGQTDRPKPICLLNFFEVGGIKISHSTRPTVGRTSADNRPTIGR